ncbi:hypothetical protein [Bradyrhizobium sp.]|jgi:hypothetical protein|uniref:hypothetical protein n=1 Tax=Bradyrhizobium sp. TaxID=376 RepID=UPI003C1BC8D5
MSRIIPLVVAVLVSPCFGSQVFAQLTPPAGTAGAGMAPINGIPYGPANPRPPSDLSGIGNASSVPPLRSNAPAITVPQAPLAPVRAAAPPSYPYASQQTISAQAVELRHKTRHRRPGHRQVSSFTGICRGC